jgi:hypothetical protein
MKRDYAFASLSPSQPPHFRSTLAPKGSLHARCVCLTSASTKTRNTRARSKRVGAARRFGNVTSTGQG